mmetsp:Transcript_66573/g.124228  ORF Transcript_66573/g.124228 Transcript_66573/m.124228 type:complete len:115 (+) Transcript_66573:121-465(+)
MSTLFWADKLWANSPAKVLLFISSSSRSSALEIKNFLKPPGMRCLVFLLFPYPILTILMLPLNFLLTTESIPLGFLQDSETLMNLSEKCLLNFLVLFFVILMWFTDLTPIFEEI